MPRYIDADVLKQKWLFRGKDGKPYRDEIDAMPTADVVEVVRCKDCKWQEYLTCSNPEGLKGWIDDECFCRFAERREEA